MPPSVAGAEGGGETDGGRGGAGEAARELLHTLQLTCTLSSAEAPTRFNEEVDGPWRGSRRLGIRRPGKN